MYRPACNFNNICNMPGFFLSIFMLVACTEGLPDYSDVQDLRVLAIKAIPPEIFVDPMAPTSVDMEFSALVVDPRGGTIHYDWSFCPVESNLACLNYDTKKAEVDDPLMTLALDDMRAIELVGNVPEKVSTQSTDWWTERGTWPYDIPNFAFTAPANLYSYHLMNNWLGAVLGAWPSAILEVQNQGESIRAAKRISVGALDLRELAQQFAETVGQTVCPQGVTPEDLPGCIPIEDRVPNTNPVFSRIQIANMQNGSGKNFVDTQIGDPGEVAGLVWVQPGASIRIRPEFTPESFETFQVLKIDLDTERIEVANRIEEISVSWFCSLGRLSDDMTWPKHTKTLDNEYTAPTAVPVQAGGRASVWLVARDQRGGVAWMSLEIQVAP